MTDTRSRDMQDQLAELVPNLRAFARSICRNADHADDLVQETLVKAWRYRSSFAAGSNLKAWLFTILRNTFVSERRKRKYEVHDHDGIMAQQLSVKAAQPGHMDLLDFSKAFEQLADEQREALLLIGAEGFSYEDAALMCGCAVGTIKSRVNRARVKLAELLGVDSAAEFGNDEFQHLNARASASVS